MGAPNPRDDLLMYRSALAYARAGFYVFPCWEVGTDGDCTCPPTSTSRDPEDDNRCSNAGKHPRTYGGVRDSSRDPKQLRRWWSGDARNANIGLDCQRSRVTVVDIDPRSGGDETLRGLFERYGEFAPTPQQLTGGGGVHYVFERPNLEWVSGGGGVLGDGVDLKADGGYIILAPSNHKSGKRYAWDDAARLLLPDPLPLAPLPAWIVDLVKEKAAAKQAPSVGDVANGYIGRVLKIAGWLGASITNGKARAQCPWEDDHTGGTRYDGSTVVYAPNPGKTFGHWQCSHSHCARRTQDEVLARFPESVRAQARRELGLPDDYETRGRLRNAANNIPTNPEPTADREPGSDDVEPGDLEPGGDDNPAPTDSPTSTSVTVPPTGGGPPSGVGGDDDDHDESWRDELVYGTGRHSEQLLSIPGNAIVLIGNLPEWRDCVQYDAFADRVVWVAPAPSLASAIGPRVGEDLNDRHCDYVQHWLSCTQGLNVSTQAVHAALVLSAHRRTVHPLQRYLAGLTWDGTPRVEKWLTTYCRARPTVETCAMGMWWLISAVARAMRPGCQVDHLLVLEGGQGAGKTQTVRVLAGSWYLGNIGDIRSKDAAINLQGNWLVEIGELDAFRGLAMTRVKDWLTQRIDVYRPPYGRIPVRRPRGCVFIATTNEREYFSDHTGARRFWPVTVGDEIDTPGLERDRDQLWAEARHLFDVGMPWWPPRDQREIRAMIAAAQEERYEVDVWEGMIDDWIKGREDEGVTIGEVLEGALEVKARRDWDRATQMRVAKALTRLGWHKPAAGKRRAGSRIWFPAPLEDSQTA